MPQHDRAPRIDVERNRRNLLDAAIAVLMENPGASMEEVAQGAQLTRATLYRHFGSREQLLDAIRDLALAQAGEAVQEARLEEGRSIDALSRFVHASISRGGRFRFLLAGGAHLEADFVRRRGEVLAPLGDVVRRGQRTGEIRRDLPADWAVMALVSLLTGGVGRTDLMAEGGPDLIVTTLLRGIGGPASMGQTGTGSPGSGSASRDGSVLGSAGAQGGTSDGATGVR